MQNLVKIQEELKNLPTQAVMAYVEGRSPVVPPYLALTELNRRKQIQKSAQAQQPQQRQTVKDQVQQQAGLMALQNQRAQAQAQNMAQQASQSFQPEAQVVPGAPVQAPVPDENGVVMAAEGGYMGIPSQPSRMYAQPQGLMQIPTPDMFQQRNFAGGGIVAFATGDKVEDEELTEEEKKVLEEQKALEENKYLQRSRAVANLPSAIADFARKYSPIGGTAYTEGIRNIINQSPEDQAKRFRAASMRPEGAPSAVPTATERNLASEARNLEQFDQATALFEKERAAKQAPVVAKAPPAVTDVTKPPVVKAPPTGIAAAPAAPKDLYAQEAENLEKLKERFGVKEQPMAESDKMIADLRKRIDAQRGDQGLEALASAMAKGAKGKKWYEAAAGFGEGYFETTEKQRKLNNEQDQAFANLQIAREKEDDARRRGDVKAVQEAVEKTRMAEINAKNAESNRIQALKPSQFKEQVELYTKDPALYAKMFPKENPLVVAAAKEYFEKEMLYKKDYPTVQDYLAAKGLSASGGTSTASTATSAPPPAAIDALKKDPKLRKQFDEKYGPGASNRYLG